MDNSAVTEDALETVFKNDREAFVEFVHDLQTKEIARHQQTLDDALAPVGAKENAQLQIENIMKRPYTRKELAVQWQELVNSGREWAFVEELERTVRMPYWVDYEMSPLVAPVRQRYKEILADEGYEGVKYMNKVEGQGLPVTQRASYILFEPNKYAEITFPQYGLKGGAAAAAKHADVEWASPMFEELALGFDLPEETFPQFNKKMQELYNAALSGWSDDAYQDKLVDVANYVEDILGVVDIEQHLDVMDAIEQDMLRRTPDPEGQVEFELRSDLQMEAGLHNGLHHPGHVIASNRITWNRGPGIVRLKGLVKKP